MELVLQFEMKIRLLLLTFFISATLLAPVCVSAQYSLINDAATSFGQKYASVATTNHIGYLAENRSMPKLSAMPVSASGDDEGPRNLLGMTAGLGYGKFRYIAEDESVYKFDWCNVKYAGVSLENFLTGTIDRVSINNELLFSTFSTTATDHFTDTLVGNPGENYYDVNLKFSPAIIMITNMVRYKLTKSDFRYYIGLGVYNSFIVSSTNKKETVHTLNGTETTSYDDAIPRQATHGLMLLASTGFSYRNFGFEFRFDPGRNYTKRINYSLYMPTFTGMLQVQFNPRRKP